MNASPTVILPPQYLGTAGYYALMASSPVAVIDTAMRYDKRFKSAHRTVIAGNSGPVTLTVPVTHTPGARTWDDVRISSHGHWWTVHTGAIESAYGRTPYFEHFFPALQPLLSEKAVGMPVALFDCIIDATIRQLLGITTRLSTTTPPGTPDELIADYRRTPIPDVAPYPQLRQDTLGFIPSLSVLDPLFNLGALPR